MVNEFIPSCEDFLAGVAVPTRKDALIVSGFAINNIWGVVYEDIIAIFSRCFADTMCVVHGGKDIIYMNDNLLGGYMDEWGRGIYQWG